MEVYAIYTYVMHNYGINIIIMIVTVRVIVSGQYSFSLNANNYKLL